MPRSWGTDGNGRSFDQATIGAVWRKGKVIPTYEPDVWRYDMCGQPMKFAEYGNTASKHGWEIDHIRPTTHGGTDDLANLQPLQWENNRRKGDTYPWHC